MLIAYLAIVTGGFLLLGEGNPATYAIVAIATAVLLVVAARTTRGGWRWRWGEKK